MPANDTDPKFLKELNDEQYKAVTAQALEHVQILAGPGTGKTKALASRIAWLILQGMSPNRIIAMTFTNSAAKELINRTGSYINDNDRAKHLQAGTFHSLCAKYLYRHYDLVGLPRSFGIADDRMKTRFLKRVFSNAKFISAVHSLGFRHSASLFTNSKDTAKGTWSIRRLGMEIGALKAQGYTVDTWADLGQHNQFLLLAYRHYTELLKEAKLLDFDDLLVYGAELLKNFPECISIDCVLIDEFQDTNKVQFDIMCHLASRNRGLTIVGDPDQSIYAFRGACPENFRRMLDEYPDTVVYYLQINYRSSQPILDASMGLMKGSNDRLHADRTLKSCKTKHSSTVPMVCGFSTGIDEAENIAKQIKYLTDVYKETLQYKDIAILFRIRSLMSSVEQQLLLNNIPYTLAGNQSFWEFFEIKTIVNYLKVIQSPFQDDAILETINVPNRHIGPSTIKKIDLIHPDYKNSWDKLLSVYNNDNAAACGNLSAHSKKGVCNYVQLILDCRAILGKSDTTNSVLKILKKIIKDTGLKKYVAKHSKKEPRVIRKNIKMLRSLLLHMDNLSTGLDELGEPELEVEEVPLYDLSDSASSDTDTDSSETSCDPLPSLATCRITHDCLQQFLRDVVLMYTDCKDEKVNVKFNKVVISTIHGAKGLEWPVVFVPTLGSLAIRGDLEEERRILFVAMTRAECLLYMSYGNMSYESNFASKFLDENVKNNCQDTHSGFKAIKQNQIKEIASVLGRPFSSATIESPNVGTSQSSASQIKHTGFRSGLALLLEEQDMQSLNKDNELRYSLSKTGSKSKILAKPKPKPSTTGKGLSVNPPKGQQTLSHFRSKGPPTDHSVSASSSRITDRVAKQRAHTAKVTKSTPPRKPKTVKK